MLPQEYAEQPNLIIAPNFGADIFVYYHIYTNKTKLITMIFNKALSICWTGDKHFLL